MLQCPICGNEILGIGEKNLSDHLLDHMTEVHEINPTWELTSGDVSNDLEEGSETVEKEIVRKDIGLSSWIAVRCPMCGEELIANDDESLSSDLRNHMLNNHSEVRRLADWSGAQRDVPGR